MNNQEKSQNQLINDYEGSILNLLNSDNYRQYNVIIAKAVGSVNAAIMLTELVQRQKYHENRDELIETSKSEGKWFYYTQDTAEDRLGLSRREQDEALKKLEAFGLIKKIILGVPGKRHFQINENKIFEINKYSKKHSRLAETAKLDCTKTPNCFGGNVQSNIGKETYKETYEETTTTIPPPFSGGGGLENIDSSQIFYTTAKGDKKIVTETEIYSHFIKSGVPPDILNQAIQELRREASPINNVMSFLQAVCKRLIGKPSVYKVELKKDSRPQPRQMTCEELEEYEKQKKINNEKHRENMKKMGMLK